MVHKMRLLSDDQIKVLSLFISRNPVSINVSASDGIPSLSAQITGITLHGVDCPVFHSFDYPHVFRVAVPLPVEKDQLARRRLEIPVLPLAPVLEPFGACLTACKFGNDPVFQITALVGAPGDEAGAPFYPIVEAVP